MSERVTLSEWKLDRGWWEQRADGPNGAFTASICQASGWGTASGEVHSYPADDKSFVAEIHGGGETDAKNRATRLLLALAGQLTDAERRALDAVMGLGCYVLGSLRDINDSVTPPVDEAGAEAAELIDARDALKAERETP